MSVQDLTVNLYGKDVSYSDALKKMALVSKMRTIEASTHFDDMGRKIEEGSHRWSQSFSNFGDRLGSWGQSALTGVIGGIAASVTSGVLNVVNDAGQAIMGQLKTSVIDYNSTLENAQIGFSTMLGSGQKASKFLNELQDFGLKTPFQTDQLIQLSQQMMGYGVAAKKVIPYLTAIGDATAAAGRTDALPQATLAFEQISARGRVDLSDVNQLTAAGVPALKIWAGAFGVSTQKILEMIHTGKWAASDALPALINGIEHGTKSTAALGGMMQKQSNTFKGAMSNISDSLNRALGTAFLPVFHVVEKLAIGIQKFTTSRTFTKWANDTGKAVGRAMDLIGNGIKQVFGDPKVQAAIGKLGQSLKTAFAAIGPALQDAMPSLVEFGQNMLPGILEGITNLVDEIPTLLKWAVQLAKGFGVLSRVIGPMIKNFADFAKTMFDVGLATMKISVIVGASLTEMALNAQNIINGFIGWLVDAGAQIPSAIARGIFGNTGPINSAIEWLTGTIKTAIEGAIGTAQSAVQGVVNSNADINSAKGALSAGMAAMRQSTVAKASMVIPHVASVITGGGLGGAGGGGGSGKTKKSFQSIIDLFRNFGADVGKGLTSGLLGTASQIKSATDKMRTAIQTAFKDGFISKGRENAALAAVSSMNSRLSKLANERATTLQNLASLKSARSGVYDNTRSSTIGAGNVIGFGPVGDAVMGLTRLVGNTKRFRSDLSSLVKKGIDQTTFSQLVAGWQQDPTTALATADSLLANPTDLKQIISLQSRLASAAGSLGAYAGHQEYDSQVNATAGKAKVLGWEMQKVASQGLRRAGGDIHIHMPANGIYVGTKDQIGKTITQVIRDGVKTGAIPKNWNTV